MNKLRGLVVAAMAAAWATPATAGFFGPFTPTGGTQTWTGVQAFDQQVNFRGGWTLNLGTATYNSLLGGTSLYFSRDFTAGTGATATFHHVGVDSGTFARSWTAGSGATATFHFVAVDSATFAQSWTAGSGATTTLHHLAVDSGTFGMSWTAGSGATTTLNYVQMTSGTATGAWTHTSSMTLGGAQASPFLVGVSTYIIYSDQIFVGVPETHSSSSTWQAGAILKASNILASSAAVTGQLAAGGWVINTSSITQGAGTGAGQISLTNATARQLDASSSSGDSTNIALQNTTAGGKTWIIASAGNTNGVSEAGSFLFYDGTANRGEFDTAGNWKVPVESATTSTMSATIGILAGSVSTQTIAAGGTITADSCGGIKKISAAGNVTTDTTNTFTAPAVGNHGCCMEVINIHTVSEITLDYNIATFLTSGAANIVMTPNDAVRVCSDGVIWRQVTGLMGL